MHEAQDSEKFEIPRLQRCYAPGREIVLTGVFYQVVVGIPFELLTLTLSRSPSSKITEIRQNVEK